MNFQPQPHRHHHHHHHHQHHPRHDQRLYPALQRVVVDVPRPASKPSDSHYRKYQAIMLAGAVIVFLMALSLIVRALTEKSFWKS